MGVESTALDSRCPRRQEKRWAPAVLIALYHRESGGQKLGVCYMHSRKRTHGQLSRLGRSAVVQQKPGESGPITRNLHGEARVVTGLWLVCQGTQSRAWHDICPQDASERLDPPAGAPRASAPPGDGYPWPSRTVMALDSPPIRALRGGVLVPVRGRRSCLRLRTT